MKNIDIIGACSDYGIHIDGTRLAPEILETYINKNNINIIKNVKAKDMQKELEKNNNKKNLNIINLFNKDLYSEISSSLDNNMLPFILGGDHSVAIASALASIKKYNNLGIIWFDAHGDYHTFETTPSGNIHGLPFAVVTNYEKTLLSTFHNGNYYNPKNSVLVGGRDIDKPDEIKNLQEAGVTVFSTEDIKKFGAEKIYKKAFEIASSGTNGIHVSYDLDVIDPNIVSGVSVPAKDGINLEEAYLFVDYMIKNKEKIKSMDLVEFNPLKDSNKKSEKIATYIINTLLDNF